MRTVDTSEITKAVRELCISANLRLPDSLTDMLSRSKKTETNPLALSILESLEENLSAAEELCIPICQDTGMAVVFAEVGTDLHITGGLLSDAVNEGVRQGYLEGFLRCSVVEDPLNRKNTGDNTPAILHTSIVSGDRLRLIVAPKGFGSENMSQIKMMRPSAGKEDVISFVLDVVSSAGSNPCPPTVVGIGIGGDFEYCALLSKKALCRSVAQRNENPFYAQMEQELLQKINQLNIGPQGFGGDTTALGVNIETFPTHIAGLPVAVNIGCHVTRHREIVL